MAIRSLMLLLFLCATQVIMAQGFATVTNLTAFNISTSTGEKPQSKVWTYDGKWWTVMPNASGTQLWRLDGTAWTSVLNLSASTNTQADCKVVGDVVHILLYKGASSDLVSVEYVPAMSNYQLWTTRSSTVALSLDAGVETAVIDIDGNGRMWLASAGTTDINVRWSDSPYSTWSAAITLASGVADDDICTIIAMPGKMGLLWSNQSTQRFGFRTHTDGDAPGTWTADEVPASQSAQNIGLGMGDDHMNLAVAADGTLYCAVKTSYDTPGYPKISLLVRRPAGTWDDLYNVSETGTRPIVVLNESAGKVKVLYSSGEGGGNILYRESPTGTISLSSVFTLISGTYNDVTSIKQNYTSEVVILASNATQAVGVSAVDSPNPLVCHLQMDEGSGTTLTDASIYGNNGTTVGSPTWTTGVINQALSLNGTSQYATVADANSLDIASAITLAAWIKPTVNATQRIIFKVAGSSGYELFLEQPAPSRVSVRFNANAGLRVNSTSSYLDFLDTWIHVAATYDGTTIRLYFNGVEQGSLAANFAIGATATALGIGANEAGGNPFNGLIDDARIYNKALSASEILALATVAPVAPTLVSPADAATGIALPPTLSWSSVPGATSYRVQVSMSADFSSTEYDLSGIATTSNVVNGLFENTQYYWRVNATNSAGTSPWSAVRSFTTSTSGAYALDLNGSTNYVDLGNDAALQLTQFTLEAWVKIEGTGVATSTGSGGITDVVPIISKGRAEAENAAVDVNYFLGYQLSTNKLVADFEDDAGSVNHPVTSNTVLGTCWTHVAATYDKSGAVGVWKLYINGVLDQTTNLSANFTPQSLSNIKACIGSSLNSTNTAAGFFNGVVDEVRIWNTVRTGAEIAADYDNELLSGSGLVARYGLNEGAGTTATNSVGPAGTVAGTPAWVGGFTPTGTTAASLDFNGTSDYVTFGAAPALNASSLTLEAWIKIQGTGGVTTSTGTGGIVAVPIITKGRGEGETPANLNMNYFLGIAGGKLSADFEEGSGPNHPVTGNATIPTDVWTHVAATYEPVSAVWNLYINGVLDKTLDIGANINPANTSIQHAGIGTAMTSTGVQAGFFGGLIDEVRIWNVARTATDILNNRDLELTTGTGLIGRWGLNEGCGLTAVNAVSGSPNGTLSSVNGPVWQFESPINGSGNSAPDQATNPTPADDATNIGLNPDLCVDVSDPDEDNLRVRYYGRPKPAVGEPFTIVWLPDTQYYVEEPATHGGTPAMFNAQTSWAVDNEVVENIVYVGQLGDCVEHGDYPSNPPLGIIEWDRAKTAMYALEPPEIPYGVCAGNHDQSPTGDPNGTTTNYNNAFGEAHFTGKPYYGGHFGANNDNHYQVFSASGLDFMVISFEYDQTAAFNATGGALDWAEDLVVANPDKKIIVMSHFVLSDNGNFSTQGQHIYTRLKVYSNFILMVGGHDPGGDGEARRSDVYLGNTVHTVLSDYQGRTNGGNGLLRIFRFEPAGNNIAVKTYSPFTNQYEQDASSEFNLAVDLGGGDPYTLIGELTNVTSGTNACVNWAALEGCTEYEWYVDLFDGNITTTGPVWSFTTTSNANAVITPDGPLNFCPGGNVTLTASGGTSYLWSTNATTDEITVTTSGTYTVEITDANGCTDQAEVTVTVNPSPTANAGTDVAICSGGSTTLSGSGGVSCAWTPATGLSDDAICDPVATPGATTTYTLVVTDANGCMDDDQVIVTVNGLPTANAGNDVAICGGGSTTLNGSGGVSCAWTPATGLSDDAICDPVATPGATTTYTLVVTDANGCEDDDQVVVTVNELPTANAGNDVAICSGGSTTLNGGGGVSCAWTPATGLSDDAICDPVATPGATTTYTLVVTDANGCEDDDQVVVTVNELPTANAGNDVAICSGGNTTLNGSGGVSCAWTPATGLSDDAICDPVATPGSTTTYTLVVTDANGCEDDDQVVVTVNGLPTANAGNDVTICNGGSTTLNGSGGVSCAWTPATGLSDDAICDPVATPGATTTYTLVVTDANGCEDDDQVTVTVNGLPTANAGNDVTICNGGSTTLNGSGGASCAWTPATGLSDDAICDPVATPGATTTYTLVVTGANGCVDDDQVLITVNTCNNNIDISGKLIWEGDRLTTMTGVNGATVNLTGDDTDSDVTGLPGTYVLTAEMGSTFTVKPVKNKPMPHATNGMNAADVSRIQQHAVGSNLLTDPYKIIAADANKNNSVTTADASLVQQAILGGVIAQNWFANNTWRFVPSAYTFPNPAIPWGFPDKITLTGVNSNQAGQDFIGLKLGDVNNTANPVNNPNSQAPDMICRIQDQTLVEDVEYTVEFRVEQFDDLLAFQYGLQFDQTKLRFVGIETIPGSPLQLGNFGVGNVSVGEIRVLMALAESMSLPAGTPLFRVKFKALQNGIKLSDLLYLNDVLLPAESFSHDFTQGPVTLLFEGVSNSTNTPQIANYSLLQNRPNPFSDMTVIGFKLPASCDAQIRIYDVNGRLLTTRNNVYTHGYHEEVFRFEDLLSEGVLYYELVTPFGILTKRMLQLHH